jgi:hypothetical protein
MKLLCWRENEFWLIACRHIDVVAQGATQDEAFKRFCQAFTFTVLGKLNPDGTIGPLPVPPPDVVKTWEEKAASTEQMDFDPRVN